MSLKENANGLAMENESVNVTNPETSPNKDDKKKKRRTIPPMWRILGKARKIFDAQLSRNNDVKLECINRFMNAETQDAEKFWGDYFEQVAKLLDSRRYVLECQRLNCDPTNLAEHIVFLGSSSINKVLKDGIYNTLGNDIRLYTDRLTPAKETDIYRNEVTAFMYEVAKTA